MKVNEIILQFIILVISVIALIHLIVWSKDMPITDFTTYYYAAKGHYLSTWLYKDYTAIIFYPFTYFNIITAWAIFETISIFSFMFLTHQLMKVRYGWITILLVLPAYKNLLQDSNVDIILSAIYIFPLPTLLGILVKPHHVIFSIVHTYKSYNNYGAKKWNKMGNDNIHSSNLLHN